MSYPTPGVADGIRFYVVGNDGYPSRRVVDMIASGLDRARARLSLAITRTYSLRLRQGTEHNVEVLSYCFKPSNLEVWDTCNFVRDVLTKTMTGLRTPDLQFCEADEAECKKEKGDGYVPRAKLGILALMGDIHVRFSLPADDMPRLLIHEATHKFAATQDVAYSITDDLRRLLHLKSIGIAGESKGNVKSNADGLANAESYAAFAMCVE